MLVSPLVRRSAFLSLAREVVGRKVRAGFASVGAMAELDQVATWANCGAMSLTGRVDGPPLCRPAGLVVAAASSAADLAAMTKRLGHEVAVDGPSLLAERAAFAGLHRRGSVSVGGAARFERCGDGWVVLNLPRPEDVAALPALVEAAVDPDDWEALRRELRRRSAADLVQRGRLLGLAIARPDERRQTPAPGHEIHRGPARPVRARPIVLDFSSLWAGPLAGSFLADAGARVIKVEGRGRPDGARSGPAGFFDLLNAGKEKIAIDFADRSDQALLRRMVAAADLVIEASRPRAMAAVGLDPSAVVDASATSWLSITGHGRIDDPDRIGFGDDAAVAGG
ncbi:MAG TPA: CoA transferase, partial [Acidimicrobiaceae bacterium]|nr:CoA transferase [Acidimicrobiaceae bacterium]